VTARRPATVGRHEGLAYSLWLPDREPRAGVVILHGAGSCKESHHDYARALNAAGLAAIAFDQRGHGESDGPMDERALDDVSGMARILRSGSGTSELPVVLRGSSAVVAICPASPEGLRRGVGAGRLNFDADIESLDAFLAAHDLNDAIAEIEVPVLLLHAAGDEQVPVEHSRELATGLRSPASRLIVLPGGHHRSIQHDAELHRSGPHEQRLNRARHQDPARGSHARRVLASIGSSTRSAGCRCPTAMIQPHPSSG
jgi:pimeloyl-ACP methyl ester carboxylesterase